MALKQNYHQISFLHLYHHTSIFAIWWIIVFFAPGGEGYFSAMLNSFIHVLMYSYYLWTTFASNKDKEKQRDQSAPAAAAALASTPESTSASTSASTPASAASSSESASTLQSPTTQTTTELAAAAPASTPKPQKPQKPKFTWREPGYYKEWMTRMQMIQFCLMFFQASYDLVVPNSYPRFCIWILFFYMMTMLALFGNFYVQAYLARGKPGKDKRL